MSQVNHPKHYNTGEIEVIDAIEDWKLGFHLGNAVKYIARAGKKDPAKEYEDLEKAAWYLRRRMELFENHPKKAAEMDWPPKNIAAPVEMNMEGLRNL